MAESRNTDAAYQKFCEFLRNAKTDSEKVAALLVASDVKSVLHMDNEAKKKLLDSISFNFLQRLVNHRDQSASMAAHMHTYKAAAFAVLSFFATNDCLIKMEELCELLPGVKQLLITDRVPGALTNGQEEAVKDCFRLIDSVIKANPDHQFLDRYIFPMLCSMCMEMEGTIYSKGAVITLTTWFSCCDKSRLDEAKLATFLTAIANQLIVLQDEYKFDLCDIITNVMSSFSENLLRTFCQESVHKLLSHLAMVLENKLGVKQRQAVLKTLCVILVSQGIDIMRSLPNGIKKLLLLVTLVSIEVQIALGKAEDFHLEESIVDLLGCCFHLMETVITFLVKKQNRVQSDDFLRAYKALSDSVIAVFTFLEKLTSSKQLERMTNKGMVAMYAMVRFVSAWTSEERCAHIERVASFLMPACIICQYGLSQRQDIFKFLLSVMMSSLTNGERQRNVLACISYLTEYLEYITLSISESPGEAEYAESERCLHYWCRSMLDVLQTRFRDYNVPPGAYRGSSNLLDSMAKTLSLLAYPLSTSDPRQTSLKRYELCLALGAVCWQVQCFLVLVKVRAEEEEVLLTEAAQQSQQESLPHRSTILAETNKKILYMIASFGMFYGDGKTTTDFLRKLWEDNVNRLTTLVTYVPAVLEMIVDDESFIPCMRSILRTSVGIEQPEVSMSHGIHAIVAQLFALLASARDRSVGARALFRINSS